MGKVYYVNTDKNKETQPSNIVCKDIAYDFSKSPYSDKVQELAVKHIEEIYNSYQKEEEEEIKDMLEAGDISSADEYDREYDKPFNKDEWEEQISNCYNKYMRNVADIPTDVVIELPPKTTVSNDLLKAAIEEKYGLPVLEIKGGYSDAKAPDIVKNKAYDSITHIHESQDYQKMLDLTANMKGYSLNNTALVIAQHPDAIAVKGYSAWNDFDRNVGKGEKGIKIWCPHSRNLTTEKQVDAYMEKNPDQFGTKGDVYYEHKRNGFLKSIKEKGYVSVNNGFSVGTVFDIMQTVPLEGKEDNLQELLDLIRHRKPLQADMENCLEVVSSIEKTMGIPEGSIEFNPDYSEQENIYKAIENYVKDVFANRPQDIVGIKSHEASTGGVHTMEVKIAAYLISKELGIEGDSKIAFELGSVMGDKFSKESLDIGRREMFETAYSRAVKFEKHFVKEFDKHFDKTQDKQAEQKKTIDTIHKDKGVKDGK